MSLWTAASFYPLVLPVPSPRRMRPSKHRPLRSYSWRNDTMSAECSGDQSICHASGLMDDPVQPAPLDRNGSAPKSG